MPHVPTLVRLFRPILFCALIAAMGGCSKPYYAVFGGTADDGGYNLSVGKVTFLSNTHLISDSAYFDVRGSIENGEMVLAPRSARPGIDKSDPDCPAPEQFVNTDAFACAVTHSRKHHLTYGPDGMELRTEGKWLSSPPADLKLLAPIRKTIIQHRHSVGHWWLTDDLRYVVILAPSQIATEDGHHRLASDALPVTISGVTVDLSQSALVFDRTAGKIFAVPACLDKAPVQRFITDVISDNGQLLLLYTGIDLSRRFSLTVTGLDGHVIRTHAFEIGDTLSNAWLGGFDNGRTIVVELVNDGPLWTADPDPGPDYRLHLWDWRSDTAQTVRLPSVTIHRAIDGP